MIKSPEQFYEEHHEDAERIEKANPNKIEEAKSIYDKHLEEARSAADIRENPEFLKQAFADYKVETKKKITEALKAKNYDLAAKLFYDLRKNINTEQEIQEEKTLPKTKTNTKEIKETSTISETKKEILKIISELDWQSAKNKIFYGDCYGEEHILNLFAEMKKFNPERFDKEIGDKITVRFWQILAEIVESKKFFPNQYIVSVRNFKIINPKIFEEYFVKKMNDKQKENFWKITMRKINQSKDNPNEFLLLFSIIKDLDPEKFQQEINANKEFISIIWPKIIIEIEKMREGNDIEYFLLAANSAQNIKPEDKPDITIDANNWNKLKKELHSARRDKNFRTFFSLINNASNLKLENLKKRN